jgi:hypothetical protein
MEWIRKKKGVEETREEGNFFLFWSFLNHYLRNELGEKFFFKSNPFESRQSIWRDL